MHKVSVALFYSYNSASQPKLSDRAYCDPQESLDA